MTRRRLVLAAALAVVALGAAWWVVGDGLTAEEQRLVDTWLGRHALSRNRFRYKGSAAGSRLTGRV